MERTEEEARRRSAEGKTRRLGDGQGSGPRHFFARRLFNVNGRGFMLSSLIGRWLFRGGLSGES